MKGYNALRRARCKRNQSGGGLGSIYSFDSAAASAASRLTANNPLALSTASSCMAAPRFGELSNAFQPRAGLPGMNGGSRRGRKGRKGTRKVRKQRGGGGGWAAAFDTSVPMGAGPGSVGPSASALGCQTTVAHATNPLSSSVGHLNVTKTGFDAGAGPGQRGGGQVSDVMTPFETVKAAAYTVNLRQFPTAAGTLVAENTPMFRSGSCGQTGGSRRKRKGSRKGSRKERKGSRKGSRR